MMKKVFDKRIFLLTIGGLSALFFSSCTTVTAKYKIKWPTRYELILLSNGEVKTVPKGRSAYKQWEIDEEGFTCLIYSRKDPKTGKIIKEKYQLTNLVLYNSHIEYYHDRNLKGMLNRKIKLKSIVIREKNGKLTYSGKTLPEFKGKLPQLRKDNYNFIIYPAPSIKLNELYHLFTVLNEAGYRRVEAEIFIVDGEFVKAKRFQIDIDQWAEQTPGVGIYAETKEFFEE